MKLLLAAIILAALPGCSVVNRISQLEQRTATLESRVSSVSATTVNEQITYYYEPPKPRELAGPMQKPAQQDTPRPPVRPSSLPQPDTRPPTPSRVEIVRHIENTTAKQSETKASQAEENSTETDQKADIAPFAWITYVLAGALAAIALGLYVYFALPKLPWRK